MIYNDTPTVQLHNNSCEYCDNHRHPPPTHRRRLCISIYLYTEKYDQNPISDWSSIENVFIACQFSNKILLLLREKISSLIDKAIIKCVLDK